MLWNIFNQGQPLTFEECRREFGLQENECFSYTQIKHWVLHNTNRGAVCRDPTPSEKWIKRATGSRGTTAQLYSMLLDLQGADQNKVKAKWQDLAGYPITGRAIHNSLERPAQILS